jgi:hypothetical protein
MIDIKELRIGNIFWEDYGGYKIVTAIGFNNVGEFPNHVQGRGIGFKTSGLFDADKIDPVPITKEIILACGFEDMHGEYCPHFRKDHLEIEVVDNIFMARVRHNWSDDDQDNSLFLTEIASLHQLQNLYFALTNTELTYKP